MSPLFHVREIVTNSFVAPVCTISSLLTYIFASAAIQSGMRRKMRSAAGCSESIVITYFLKSGLLANTLVVALIVCFALFSEEFCKLPFI